MAKHPIQPLEKDQHDFSQEDREQFAQLIGYSLSGFGELSYVSDETCENIVMMPEVAADEADTP